MKPGQRGLALPSDCTSCLHQLKSTVKLQQERQGYQHLVQEETDSAMRAKAQMLCVSVAGEHLPGGCAHDRRPGKPADSSSDPTGLGQEAPRRCSLSSGSAKQKRGTTKGAESPDWLLMASVIDAECCLPASLACKVSLPHCKAKSRSL